MSHTALNTVLNILLWAGGVMTLYSLYFCIIAMFGFKHRTSLPPAALKTRFALVVAARNEEAVIGHLVDSLLSQNYPRELYRVIVAPNNCTDNTRAVALAHGASIFDPVGKITCKGQVLAQINDQLMAENCCDAVCVFDADNLVHPNFLQKMNHAYQSGARVAQGFRDSKNPEDSPISTCYSVVYWMLGRFYNAGRSALGLSALINGSGFMVGMDVLRQLGGWQTKTMTEDYEFTAQCALAGYRVHYVPGAVIYDEQSLTFFQSWRQRRRWTTGSVQGMMLYFGRLCKGAVQNRSLVCADLAVTFLTPAVQAISLLLGGMSMVLGAYRVLEWHIIPPTRLVLLALAAAGLVVLVCCLLAIFVVLLHRADLRGTTRGILYFPVFLASQVAVSLVSLVKPKRSWDAIIHTQSIGIADMARP